METAARRLRQQVLNNGLVRAMSTHSPLSARLAEEAGFDALWASGFELSALYGLPDVSLISMTQHLDMVRAIIGQCKLPLIADIDTGNGNALNVLHTMREYERAGVAAVVMEDKTFPKVTSLIADGRQELVRIEEFQGKLEAARAARTDPDLLVIARTEALIAGLGQEEALRRAAAYAEAGADMVLVHSKQKTPDEVEAFIRAWNGAVPIALVPTAYPEMDERRILALGGKVGLVIYANHAIRAAVQAMQKVFAMIRSERGIQGADREIASVEEIFRLQGMDRVKADEKKFLR